MKKLAPASPQQSLFYQPPIINATGSASARNAYGAAAQELVIKLLDLEPIKINGQYSTCFDGKKGEDYYEIKSVKRGGSVVCYDWRMVKESEAEVMVYYAILIHQLKGEREDIFQKFADHDLTVIVAPAKIVHTLAYQQKLYIQEPKDWWAEKRCGWVREGYNRGYRNVPVKVLLSIAQDMGTLANPYGKGVVAYREMVGRKV